MVVSTAVSVAAFSVVLAESFVAAATSTLVPATFLAVARGAKAAVGGAAPANSADPALADPLVGNMPGVKEAVDALRLAVNAMDEIDLLVPKTAKIHAEFEFEASESYAGHASIGAMVNVVSVSAGYSALYQTSTRNKITLDVDFAAVNYKL
jgi:hypothetical protein